MRDVKLLHPELQAVLAAFLSKCDASGLRVGVSQTMRTKAEQEALYAQGRTTPGNIVTKCRYPYSPHCWGVAFDIYRNDGKGAYNDSDGWFAKCGKIGKSVGLFWGGDFKSFVDKPHFELETYLPNNSCKTLIRTYGTPEKFFTTWKEEDTMTEEQVRAIIKKVDAEKAAAAPDGWSADDRAWAEANGIITGDEHGMKQYKAACTREMMVVFLKRLADKIAK